MAHEEIDCMVQSLEEGMPDEEILYDLADLFKVFSDTTRIKILYSLMGGEQRVADIAEAIGATQSAVSHQLRILKTARLVKFQRDGKNVLYSLADDHVYTMLAQGMSHICE
jgi:DNA-binding transcriptional ArsR family regulator